MDLDPATYGFDLATDWERPLNLEGAFVGNVKGLMGNADVNQVLACMMRKNEDGM